MREILSPENIRGIFHWEAESLVKLHEFAYGNVWWGLLAITTAPFYAAGAEQGMVIVARLLSLIPALGLVYLTLSILLRAKEEEEEEEEEKKINKLYIYLIVTFCFFLPISWLRSNKIYPQAMYGFFLILAFFFLYKDNFKLGKNFYYSIIAFGFSISTKITAGIFSLAYLYYFFLNKPRLSVKVIAKSIGLGIITVLFLNIPKLHPEVWKHYLTATQVLSKLAINGPSDKILSPYSIEISMPLFETFYQNIYLILGS